MRIVGLVAVLLSLGQSLAAVNPPATPFSLGPHGGLVVPVEINGTGPHRVLLDTGANHSSISEELALVLNAQPVARALVSTPAGDRERPVVAIERLGLGPITVTARATTIPARELRLAGNVAGVVGQDVLAGLRYTIDYQRRRIAWDDREPEARAPIAVLPLAFRDGLPVVDLAQGASMLRLVADSGAGGLVLYHGDGDEMPAMTPDGGLVRVVTFHGTTMARSVRIDRFRVGTATYRDYPAVLLPRTAALAHRGDGLLPLHIFNRVTFDGPAGRLILG